MWFGGNTPINQGIILPFISGSQNQSNYANHDFFLGFNAVANGTSFYAALNIIRSNGQVITSSDLGSFKVNWQNLDSSGTTLLSDELATNTNGYLGSFQITQNMKKQATIYDATGAYYCSTQVIDFKVMQ